MTRSQEDGKLEGEEFQVPNSQCSSPEARKSLTHLRTHCQVGQAEEADREQTRQSRADQGKGLFPGIDKPGRMLSRWKAKVLSQRT